MTVSRSHPPVSASSRPTAAGEGGLFAPTQPLAWGARVSPAFRAGVYGVLPAKLREFHRRVRYGESPAYWVKRRPRAVAVGPTNRANRTVSAGVTAGGARRWRTSRPAGQRPRRGYRGPEGTPRGHRRPGPVVAASIRGGLRAGAAARGQGRGVVPRHPGGRFEGHRGGVAL